MNRLARSYLKALACCASTVIVSGLAVSQAHADSLPPTPAIGTVAERSQLPPSPPEIVSGALNSRLLRTQSSPFATSSRYSIGAQSPILQVEGCRSASIHKRTLR
jgi:hypothetical protein